MLYISCLAHRENALKAHQYISYCSILVTLKNNFNTKSDQKFHQDASNCTFFKKISRRVACPPACVQLISLSLYEKKKNFHSECNQNVH